MPMVRHIRPLIVLLMLVAWALGAGPAWSQEFYSIQVSAYKTADKAARDVAGFKAKGLESFSRLETAGEKGQWYRVYVGHFSTKKEAQAQAVKLKDKGLVSGYAVKAVSGGGEPTGSVENESVGSGAVVGAQTGKTWGQGPIADGPNGFEVIVDLSGSINDEYRCSGHSKHEAIFTLLKKMNNMIPGNDYQAAMRKFGYKRALTRDDYTKLVWGVAPYDRQQFSLAIDDLRPSDAISPLGWSIQAADNDLAGMSGRKALIVVSDFKENRDFGDPVLRSQSLKTKYGQELAVYSIIVGQDEPDITVGQQVSQVGGGKYYDGCRLLTDEAYFETMIREIFGVPAARPVVAEPVCPDADGDGVCDDRDLCPNTPKGAPVDERGCWIAAYSQFFDFNKAVVKKAYLSRLKAGAKIIKAHPDIQVLIAGHTDNIGTADFNQKLGLKRAEAVRDVLIKEGVPKSQLKVRSFGRTKPVADNKTEAGRAKNRRVEFHVGEYPADR